MSLELSQCREVTDPREIKQVTNYPDVGGIDTLYVFPCGCYFQKLTGGLYECVVGNASVLHDDKMKVAKWLESTWHEHEHK